VFVASGAGLLVLLAAAFVLPLAAVASQPVNPQARALKEFGDRVQAYMLLRGQLARSVAPVSAQASPEQIRQHQQELAAAIRQARQHAKAGDIFTPPVVPQFRTVIRSDIRSRDVRDALAALQEVPSMPLQVNAEWPAGVARVPIPPRLLANLYPLPNGLQYRFVARHLVIVDDEAAIIVDFIRDVVPTVNARR
jgi:HAMP domain-containing protein